MVTYPAKSKDNGIVGHTCTDAQKGRQCPRRSLALVWHIRAVGIKQQQKPITACLKQETSLSTGLQSQAFAFPNACAVPDAVCISHSVLV